MKKLKRGEREVLLSSLVREPGQNQESVADLCGCSKSAISQALEASDAHGKPPIVLVVNKRGEVTDAYEQYGRQRFKFRFDSIPE